MHSPRPQRLIIDASLGPSSEGPSRSVDLTDAELAQRERDQDEAAAFEWALLRAERNARLAACDWTQIMDAPLAWGERYRWKLYRRALRDLPARTADPRAPEWPEVPR